MDFLTSFDCNPLQIDNTKIDLLNQHLQTRRMGDIQVDFTKEGPDHMPIFTGVAIWEKNQFWAKDKNKNDVKKKIKTGIYDFINQDKQYSDSVKK